MKKSFITIGNVHDVAKILDGFHAYPIKLNMLEDYEDYIIEFDIALNNFNHSSNEKINPHHSIYNQRLEDLLAASKNLYYVLTEDAKDFIEDELAKKLQ